MKKYINIYIKDFLKEIGINEHFDIMIVERNKKYKIIFNNLRTREIFFFGAKTFKSFLIECGYTMHTEEDNIVVINKVK